jgi:membrane protein
MRKILNRFRETVLQALAHDVINTAKAAAYSGMLMLFPALLVITTLVAQVQEGGSMLGELRSLFEQFLPVDALDLLQSSVLAHRVYSRQLILSATSLSIFAGLGVMLSLMEGFRRAYRLHPEAWSFWSRRARALMLLPISMVPLSVATLVIVFGRQIELWIIDNAGHELRHIVLFFWRAVRWSIALLTSASVLSVLYHFGTKRKEHWLWVAPGAFAGSLIWFPATLVFGWYVTRIADYSRFYGSFGAGIATLVWLYITAFSVLMGAELNGVLYWSRQEAHTVEIAALDIAPEGTASDPARR